MRPKSLEGETNGGVRVQCAKMAMIMNTGYYLAGSFVSSVLAAFALIAPSASDAAQHYVGERERVLEWAGDAPADRVRFGVRDTGVYAVTDAELASASGLAVSNVTEMIDCGEFGIECQGEPVAWERYSGGVRFYGQALPFDARAPENVYFATFGAASPRMSTRSAAPVSGGAVNTSFGSVKHVGETTASDTVNYCSKTNHSMLYIKFLTPGSTYTGNVSLPNVASGNWTGKFSGRLYSMYGADVSYANFTLGDGTLLTNVTWSGEAVATFSVEWPSSKIASGKLSFKLKNTHAVTGEDSAGLFLEYIDMAYQMLYKATDNLLLCTGGSATNIQATGFSTTGAVCAWDVTDPLAPVALADLGKVSGGAKFACGGTDSRYAVFNASYCFQPSVRGVRDVRLGDPSNRAEHVIIIPPEGWVDGFRSAMQVLADYRTRTGVPSVIVDAESIYNQYSRGIVDVEAIRAFIADAYGNWGSAPKYVLLAGQGNDDFHHAQTGFQGKTYSPCLLPPILMSMTADGKGEAIASDMLFGDVLPSVSGPEVVVGRFPAVTAAQAQSMVDRTIMYEMRRTRRQKAVAAADYERNHSGIVSFAGTVRGVTNSLASTGCWTVSAVIPNDKDPNYSMYNERNDCLLPALQSDLGFFYYYGHSNYKFIGGAGNVNNCLLWITHLSQWDFPPIAMLLCCNVGMWHASGVAECFCASAVNSTTGGFVATVASAGVTIDTVGDRFTENFFKQAKNKGTLRLGDAFRDGVKPVADFGYPQYYYAGLGILGDPAIIIRPDRPQYGWFMIR